MTLRIAIAALALVLTALTPVARAQGPGGQMPPEIAEFQKSLKITPEQQKKLGAISKKYQPRILALQKKYAPQMQKLQQSKDPKAREQGMALMQKVSAEMKPITDAAQKESEAIFTPEQRAKIKAFQAKMTTRFQQQMGGAPKR